jgi:hypothetical protein
MSWRSHIDKTVKKANSTLGFLRRNLKVSNQDTKTAAYKTFMECAAFIWMEIHSPFLFPVCQFVEVILEYNGIFVRSNIPVENTIIRKESYQSLVEYLKEQF